MSFQFFDKLYENLKLVETEEEQAIIEAVNYFETAVNNKNSIYIFGASHAGLVSQEMFYRAGGFMLFNPILPKELSLDNRPISLTSQMERLEGYGSLVLEKANTKKDDLIVLHSVSGRNPAAIDMAIKAKEIGMKIIVITNLAYSKTVSSRHESGKMLYEFADLVIDNHGAVGDAICEFENSEQKVGATSNIIATAILNSVIVELADRMIKQGNERLPFFYSANIDGGDEKNKELFEMFKDQIHYNL